MTTRSNLSHATHATASPPEAANDYIYPSCLTPAQLQIIHSDIPPDHIKRRRIGGGKEANYTQKEYVFEELQDIFGIENVTRETLDLTELSNANVQLKRKEGDVDGWISSYRARCRLTINVRTDKETITFVREGTGTCSYTIALGDNLFPPEAMEIAIKGAESDALKRAAATLGRHFGAEIERQRGPEPVASASHTALQRGNNAQANQTGPRPASTAQACPPAPKATPAAVDTKPGPQVQKLNTTTAATDGWDAADPFAEPAISQQPATPKIIYGSWPQAKWIEKIKELDASARTNPASINRVIAELKEMCENIPSEIGKQRDWCASNLKSTVSRITKSVAEMPFPEQQILDLKTKLRTIYDGLPDTAIKAA
jgi:hypothetical protein